MEPELRALGAAQRPGQCERVADLGSLRVAHALNFGNERKVELSADLFNVLGLEAPITYYENDNESFGKTMYHQAPRSLRLGARFFY